MSEMMMLPFTESVTTCKKETEKEREKKSLIPIIHVCIKYEISEYGHQSNYFVIVNIIFSVYLLLFTEYFR